MHKLNRKYSMGASRSLKACLISLMKMIYSHILAVLIARPNNNCDRAHAQEVCGWRYHDNDDNDDDHYVVVDYGDDDSYDIGDDYVNDGYDNDGNEAAMMMMMMMNDCCC